MCASMLGTSIFPDGGAPDGSARLLSLALSTLVMLIPVVMLCCTRFGSGALSASHSGIARILYRGIMLMLALCFMLRCSYMLSLYSGMIELYLLERTPSFAVISVLLVTAYIIAGNRRDRILRIAELIIMLVAVPLALLFIFGLYRADFGEWRILLQPDKEKIYGQAGSSLMCCSGCECAFFFMDNASPRKRQRRALLLAYIITCVLSCLSYLLCAGILTVKGADMMNYPLVETARVINIGGVAFTDRFDLLLMVIMIALLPAEAGVFLHCACDSVKACIGGGNAKLLGWLMLPVGFTAWAGQYAQYNEPLRRVSIICYIFTAFAAMPALFVLSRCGGEAGKGGGGDVRTI